jgi:hypothetical protein
MNTPRQPDRWIADCPEFSAKNAGLQNRQHPAIYPPQWLSQSDEKQY